jgi:hypothetical protein
MSNARIMLLAIGEQDSMINQNAEYTFFQRDTKTHTQFGTDWLVVSNNDKNTTNFIYDNMGLDIHVPINGDVLTDVYLRIKLDVSGSSAWDYSGNIGTMASNTRALETFVNIIDTVQFIHNNKVISELDSLYILSYYDLYLNQQQKNELVPMVSYEYAKRSSASSTYPTQFVYLYIPLPFWFHKSPMNAFPLWAIKDNNITIRVTLKQFKGPSTRSIRDIECLYKYGFLTPEEKERFTNLPLEYIIKQVNRVDKVRVTPNSSYKLTIPQTHYIEYLLWNISLMEGYQNTSNNISFVKLIDGVKRASLNINGNMLVDTTGDYFKLVQRYQHFKCDSAFKIYQYNDISSAQSLILHPNEYNIFPFYYSDNIPSFTPILPIYSYNFGLEPILNKDTGFLSTDQFTHSQLTLEFNSLSDVSVDPSGNQFAECNVYLVRHNIIRIKDGILNILFA